MAVVYESLLLATQLVYLPRVLSTERNLHCQRYHLMQSFISTFHNINVPVFLMNDYTIDWLRIRYSAIIDQIGDLAQLILGHLIFKPRLFSKHFKGIFYFNSHIWMTYCHHCGLSDWIITGPDR